MVYRRATAAGGGGIKLGGLGSGAPVPTDVVVLLVVLFVTYALQFFRATAVIPALLRLGPSVLGGAVWKLATYPFAGFGGPSVWFLLELLMIFWFGRDVFLFLGRRRFWRLLAWATLGAGVVASLTQLMLMLLGLATSPELMFHIMQGQYFVLAFLIAAFANVNGDATILLFFVLPVKARWFLWIEALIAFVVFLGSKDFAGFVGICTALAIVTALLGAGGPRGALRRLRLRWDRLLVQLRLARLRSRRRFDVYEGGSDRDRWVH